jgi:hypothetical protein
MVMSKQDKKPAQPCDGKCGGKCGNKDCPCSVKDKGTGTGTTTGGNKAKGGDCGCQTKKK